MMVRRLLPGWLAVSTRCYRTLLKACPERNRRKSMESNPLGRPFRLRGEVAGLVLWVLVGAPWTAQAVRVQPRPTLKPLEEIEQPLVWLDSIDQAVNVAGDEYRPIFVLFSSPSCAWCHRLKEMSLTEPKVRELLKEFKLVEIDVTINPLTAQQFQVRGVPTVAVLSSDGRARQVMGGYLSPSQLESVLREALNPEFLKARDAGYGTLLTSLRKGGLTADQWPVVLAHLSDAAKRDEVRETVLGLDPFPATHLVELLQHPRLGIRLAAIEVLEERAGRTWGYDPWQPVSGVSELSDAMLRWREWAAGITNRADVVYSAITEERLAGYIKDLVSDDRERSIRAMRMLEQGGQAVAEALGRHVEEHPDLPVGHVRRLREVRYALLLDGMHGLDAIATAHRLVYGTLDARLRALASLPPGDPNSLRILTDFLLEDDAIVRESAAEALILAGSFEAIPIVETFLEGERDPNVIYAALRGLGEVRSRRGLKILTQYLGHSNEDLVIAALQSIGKLRTSLSAREVAACLDDSRWRIRVAALETIGKLGLSEQVDAVVKRVKDDDEFVRLTAIKTFAGLKPSQEATAELEQAFLRDDTLKGPVIAAFGSMDKDLPDSFREAIKITSRDTIMNCLVALEDCGAKAKAIAGDYAGHADDDLACLALSIVARYGLDADGPRAQLLAALKSGNAARQLVVLESMQIDSRMRRQILRAFPEWQRAASATPSEPSPSSPPAGDLDSHEALFAAFGQARPVAAPAAAEDPGQEQAEGLFSQLVAAFGGKEGTPAAADPDVVAPISVLMREVERIADEGETDELRFTALRVLASAGCVQVVPRLADGIEKRSAEMRCGVARMLSALPHSESLSLLKGFLRDPAESVRETAVESCLEQASKLSIEAVFEELLRKDSLLSVQEVFGYKLERIADDKSKRRYLRPWRDRLLADERPRYQVMGLVLLDAGWDRAVRPRVDVLAASEAPLVRRAAWHALGWHAPTILASNAVAIASDPSDKVRAVLPSVLATDSVRWTHYFDDETTWSAYLYRDDYGRRGRKVAALAPELKTALTTLTADPSPKIRIDAFLRLLERQQAVDLQAYVAALRAVPDTQAAAYDIKRYLVSNAARLGPEFAVLLPFLEENRVDQEELTQIRRGLKIDDTEAAVSLEVQRLMRQVEKGQAPVIATFRVADSNEVAQVALDEPPLVVFFYSPGCHDCLKVEKMLENLAEIFEGLEVEQLNILKIDAMRLNEALCERFRIPAKKRSVTPAVFTGAGGLVKTEITSARLAELLVTSLDVPRAAWYEMDEQQLAEAEAGVDQRADSLTVWLVLWGGLVDGVNPCAFATIIFFLSYLHIKRRTRGQILAVGISFIAGVFVAYFALGLGLLKLIKDAPVMTLLGQIMNWCLAGFALVIMVLNLRDGVLCLQGRMKEMTLQLPGALKRQIHGVIREGSKHSRFVMAAFVVGLLVSVLELACTGQVYLPILVKISQNRTSVLPYGLLLLYNVAFIVPLIVIFVLAFFGLTHEQLTRFMQRHAVIVKFATALLFLALFLYFVLTNLR